MLRLMVEKLAERKQRINDALSGRTHISDGGDNIVSDKQLFRQLGNKLKIIKAN